MGEAVTVEVKALRFRIATLIAVSLWVKRGMFAKASSPCFSP